MTTEAQIEANRENAQLSTGPKDTEKTKYNALKHGLTAKKLIDKEDQDLFLEIFDALYDEYSPKNATELLLIERASFSYVKIIKISEIESARMHNKEIFAKVVNISESMTNLNPFQGEEESVPCPSVSEADEKVYKYGIQAENSFYKALNTLRTIKKM